ncbi:MAG: hypothetical protein ACFFDI_13845 [Promethearchaeota archaeon]
MERALAGQVNFNNIFLSPLARFSWFIVILVFLTTLAFSWLVIHALLTFRKKDVATMVSLGGIRTEIHAFFLAEIMLVLILGIAGGLGTGLLFAVGYHFSLSLMGFGSEAVVTFPLVVGITLLTLVGSYLVASGLVTHRTKKYYTELAEPNVPIHSFLNQKISHRFFALKFALLTLSRRVMKVQYLAFFFVGFTLVTLTLGGSIVKNTTISYMEQAIGTNTYVVGHTDVTALYVQNLAFTGRPMAPAINLTDPQYRIEPTILANLSQLVTGLDARFLFYAHVRELAAIIFTEVGITSIFANESEYAQAFMVIGANRSGYLYAFGLNDPLSHWVVEDGSFTLNSTHVVIGNLAWYSLFDDPFQEQLGVYSPVTQSGMKKFHISGIIQDPFAAGMTCYMKLDVLRSTFFPTSLELYNLVITQVDPSQESALFNFAAAHHLSIEPLEPVKQANREAQNALWVLNILAGVPLSLAMMGGISSVFIATAEEERADLQIIRALGGRKRQMLRLSYLKMGLMLLIPWVPALLIGSLFSSTVLIAAPAPPDIWALVWIGFNVLLSFLVGGVGTLRQNQRLCAKPVF